MIVSRDNEDIRAKLGPLTSLSSPRLFEYSLSAHDTKDDIDLCAIGMVNKQLSNKPQKLKTQLATEAAKRSDGMFLWLHLLSHELDPGENAKRLRTIVSEMPAEINETYERDLEKVNNLRSDQKERAVAILRWILFAVRPLTVRELAEAIALANDETEETYPEDELPDAWDESFVDEQYVNSYIRRSCGSLVELRSKSPDEVLALHTVHFVHFSVKEFLLRSGTPLAGQSRLETICFPDGSKEHDRLARLCLQYLCYDVFGEKEQFDDGRRIRVYPFLAYAARSWYTHALHDHRMSENLMHYVAKLFNPATANWILWSKVFEGELDFNDEAGVEKPLQERCGSESDSDGTQDGCEEDGGRYSDLVADINTRQAADIPSNEGQSIPGCEDDLHSGPSIEDPSPIYYASLLGLTDIISALQSQGIDCNASGGRFGYPLQAAVCNDQIETVTFLLQQKVDVNQCGGLYGSALGAAAYLGLEPILRILLEAGANPLCKDTDGRNTLHLACCNGALATAKVLLGHDSGLMQDSEYGQTPFYDAVESGDCHVVTLLLDAGADTNSQDADGTPALLRAVALGYQQVVETLINRGADVSIATSTGLTCLHEAVYQDNLSITLTLLAKGASIDAQDNEGWYPLHQTLASGALAAAKLLIERGACVNVPTNEGWTPLHIAAEQGDDEILRILLDKGAEVDAQNSSSYTSLFSAVRAQKFECVKVLLARGADVSRTNNTGDTVLDDALQRGSTNIVQVLLEHNALHDLDDGLRSLITPISTALLNKDEDQALQLITSSDTRSQEVLDSTLLSCSLFGAADVAEMLLNRGASLTALTYSKRTPLHLAARHGYKELVQSLLKYESNLFAQDIIGSRPLDLAVSAGLANIEMARSLVNAGALAQDLKSMTDQEMLAAFEGPWKGTYTYSSWNKGVAETTAVTVSFENKLPEDSFPRWTCVASDEAGDFEVMGHLLVGGLARFVKLYEKVGWLCLGIFDADAMTIVGTWGSNYTVRHGSFEMKKLCP